MTYNISLYNELASTQSEVSVTSSDNAIQTIEIQELMEDTRYTADILAYNLFQFSIDNPVQADQVSFGEWVEPTSLPPSQSPTSCVPVTYNISLYNELASTQSEVSVTSSDNAIQTIEIQELMEDTRYTADILAYNLFQFSIDNPVQADQVSFGEWVEPPVGGVSIV